jgi:curved DNA-binding protein CbpA
MRHISENKIFNYTRADLQNLKTLGLETGASSEEIKKAYKRLVKHCHPDQNPDLENGEYIFNTIIEAYNALKNKDFK